MLVAMSVITECRGCGVDVEVSDGVDDAACGDCAREHRDGWNAYEEGRPYSERASDEWKQGWTSALEAKIAREVPDHPDDEAF